MPFSFESCALMSCAPWSMVSTSPTPIPFSFIILLKSSAVPRPQSLLMTRKSTFFSASLSTIPLKAAASIDDGGEMRKM